MGPFGLISPVLDRFVIAAPSGGTIAVYDLRTGKIGDLGIRSGKNAGFAQSQRPASPLYWAMTTGGYVIVDLAAI